MSLHVVLKSISTAEVKVDAVNYYRRGATVTLNDTAKTLSFSDKDGNIIFSNKGFALVEVDGEGAFTSYNKMKDWVNKHMVFTGNTIISTTTGVLIVNGEFFEKGELKLVSGIRNGLAEGYLTLRTNRNDFNNVITNVHYSNIFPNDDLTPFPDVLTTATWFIENFFVQHDLRLILDGLNQMVTNTAATVTKLQELIDVLTP